MPEPAKDSGAMTPRDWAHSLISLAASIFVAWYLATSDYFGVQSPWVFFVASAGFATLFLVGVVSERALLGDWFATKKRWRTYSTPRRWAEGWSMWLGITLGTATGLLI